MLLSFYIKEYNIDTESTIQVILYFSQPIRLKIFWSLAIKLIPKCIPLFDARSSQKFFNERIYFLAKVGGLNMMFQFFVNFFTSF